MKKIFALSIFMILFSAKSFAEQGSKWRLLFYNLESQTGYFFSEKSVIHNELGWCYSFKEERKNVPYYFTGRRHCKREEEKIFIKSTNIKICENKKCKSIKDVDWKEAEQDTINRILCVGDV